jgi:pyruvate kinase
MNFSHGDYEWHQRVVDTARKTEARNPMIPLAVALDTKGPEIRTGLMKEGLSEIRLEMGTQVTITTDDEFKTSCDEKRIWLDYVNLTKVIKEGDLIYIDDGLVSLKVKKIVDDKNLETEVINTGVIGSRKGVNLPDVNVDLPALSEKDKKDLAFGVKNDVDMIFASFIRKKADIEEIRAVLGEEGKAVKIIAKIENHEGVRNFDEILEATDGVMVARGDLGIEIPAEKVFEAQKMMIAKCNLAGKSVICATQMLESMTVNPRPTRAEVSDVANAVIDGSDCVMLSGETAKGKYPVQAVSMMHKIAREAESSISYKILHNEIVSLQPKPSSVEDAIAASAVAASYQTMAGAIIVLTTSGKTAISVSKFKPSCPILTVTRNRTTARQAHLYRGCTPLWYNKERKEDWPADVEARFEAAIEFGKSQKILSAGDVVLGLQGSRKGSGTTNTLRFLVCP